MKTALIAVLMANSVTVYIDPTDQDGGFTGTCAFDVAMAMFGTGRTFRSTAGKYINPKAVQLVWDTP